MLQKIRNEWKERIESVLAEFAQEKGITLTGEITVGKPPKAEQGDLAFAMFTYAKSFAMAPALIAKEVASRLEKRSDLPAGQILVLGPYVNIKIDTAALAGELARTVLEEGDGICEVQMRKDNDRDLEYLHIWHREAGRRNRCGSA